MTLVLLVNWTCEENWASPTIFPRTNVESSSGPDPQYDIGMSPTPKSSAPEPSSSRRGTDGRASY
jgi:hypothetical protein